LAIRAAHFADRGVIVAAPRHDAVKLMRNKWALHKYFRGSRVRTIPTYQREEYLNACNSFPCVAKKAEGRSSEGMFVIEQPRDLRRAELKGDDYIFQPFVIGPALVADVLKSGDESPVIVARRELTRTKNGAGIAVQILDNDAKLRRSIEYICNAIDFEGCINIEFISPRRGGPILMDINPRFSAGVAFSALAGYDFVRNHVQHFLRLPVDPLGKVAYNTVFTRKYMEVVV
jgi:carbamoyl-phosphate synthase large subunit